MPRCTHTHALIRSRNQDRVSAYCPDCGYHWWGLVRPWRSHRGRIIRPPGWVLRLIESGEE